MLTKTSPSLLRQQWLHDAEVALRGLFNDKGYKVPAAVRTSIGFPKGTRDGKLAIGQCWAIEASTDEHNEIFISPELGHQGKQSIDGSIRILGVLAHELAHSVSGNKAGHRVVKRPEKDEGRAYEKWHNSFPTVAGTIGLVAPWTATTESPEFVEWGKGIVKKIGTFPAGALASYKRKKDGCRQRKCECATCGYIVRTTKKWIETAGPPICPTDKKQMECEEVDED